LERDKPARGGGARRRNSLGKGPTPRGGQAPKTGGSGNKAGGNGFPFPYQVTKFH